MTKPTKVQAPEGCSSYLTAGRIYDIGGFWRTKSKISGRYGFRIVDDEGEEIHCREQACPHLNGGDWIIVETV
jgi:hypothetical protein